MKSNRNCSWLRVFAVGALGAVAGFQGAQSAWAQSTGGSIAGTIHDPAGAAVMGAELTIKNLANDKTRSAKSDAAGAYNIQNLTPGAYEITAAKYAFSDAKTRVVLAAHRQLRAALKLKLTAVDANAEAPADAKKLEAMEARVGALEAELRARNNAAAAAPGPVLLATTSKDSIQLPALLPRPNDQKELSTINGASASTGTPYFTENPGQPAHMWDNTIILQYMPKEHITWWMYATRTYRTLQAAVELRLPEETMGCPRTIPVCQGPPLERRTWWPRKWLAAADAAASGSRIFATARPSCRSASWSNSEELDAV